MIVFLFLLAELTFENFGFCWILDILEIVFWTISMFKLGFLLNFSGEGGMKSRRTNRGALEVKFSTAFPTLKPIGLKFIMQKWRLTSTITSKFLGNSKFVVAECNEQHKFEGKGLRFHSSSKKTFRRSSTFHFQLNSKKRFQFLLTFVWERKV